MPVTIRLPILLALTVLVAALGAFSAPSAAAATPCWKQLINDWYDGRIDKTYPVSCYRAAIKNLPEDVRSYSEAREDIERALLAAIRESEQSGEGPLGPSDPVPPEPAPTGTNGETSTTTPGLDPEDEGEGEAAPLPGGGDPDEGGILEPFRPANADSVPIPLLVLAGLALLLLAAAGAGFVARRIQARRVRVSTLPPRPDRR